MPLNIVACQQGGMYRNPSEKGYNYAPRKALGIGGKKRYGLKHIFKNRSEPAPHNILYFDGDFL